MQAVYLIPIVILVIVIASHILGLIFKLNDDRIYSPFHFVCGGLVAVWYLILFDNPAAAILLTLSTGAIWEIYEWYMWKWVLKKPIYKPKPWDTRNDMILDFVGAIIGVSMAGITIVS